jgi:hypothetical protein
MSWIRAVSPFLEDHGHFLWTILYIIRSPTHTHISLLPQVSTIFITISEWSDLTASNAGQRQFPPWIVFTPLLVLFIDSLAYCLHGFIPSQWANWSTCHNYLSIGQSRVRKLFVATGISCHGRAQTAWITNHDSKETLRRFEVLLGKFRGHLDTETLTKVEREGSMDLGQQYDIKFLHRKSLSFNDIASKFSITHI